MLNNILVIDIGDARQCQPRRPNQRSRCRTEFHAPV